MFKGNKNTKQTKQPKGAGGAALLAEMGIAMPDFDDPNFGADDGEDDADLAAELEMLQQADGTPAKKRATETKKKPAASKQDLQSFHQDVNKLLSDIERPINDEDLSDVDEAELLDELNEMTGGIEFEEQQPQPKSQPQPQIQTKPAQPASAGGTVSVLEGRLEMYKKAVETAKANQETAKARRYERQLNCIKELLQTARAGKPINESEIPPPIGGGGATAAVPSAQSEIISEPVPTRAPSPPPRPTPAASLQKSEPSVVTNNSDDPIARLRKLALQAQAEGDLVKANEYVMQIRNLRGGAITNSAPAPPQPSLPASTQATADANMPEDENSAPPPMPLVAPEPRTVMEALQQRHEEFSKRHKDAAAKGESAKARRLDRVTKQYQEAIEATRKGRPYDYSELPDLPGFAPIPVQQSNPQPPPPPPPSATAAAPVKPTQSTAQVRPTQSQPQRPTPTNGSLPQASASVPSDPQVQSIRLKQDQLRKRAIDARQKGDTETALRFMQEFKRLEQMIASVETDPVVDTHQTSDSPVEGFETVRDDEFTEEVAQSSRDAVYRRLQDDLLQQVQLCARNQQMYAQMEGSNSAVQAKEFKLLELRCARDLERLKQSFQQGSKAPIFHYEKRQMNVIHVNNDLTDDFCEVTVLRGINLQVPSGYSPAALQTYVILEFTYPIDTIQTFRTGVATGSNNAEYPSSGYRFSIKRTDSKFKRVINRKELKLSIFYKAGFLRPDRQLGVAFVKLTGLEQSATIHESVDVYENDHRKKVGGKLEVKIRIKEATGAAKSSELLSQRWLVIDRFEDTAPNGKPSAAKSIPAPPSIAAISQLIPTGQALGLLALSLAGNHNNNNNDQNKISDNSRSSAAQSNNNSRQNSPQRPTAQSIQVLQYEAESLEQQIETLEDHLTPDQIEQLRMKHKLLKEQTDRVVKNLREGGKQGVEDHIRGLQQLLERYTREEEECRQRNDKKKADAALHRKNLVAKEIETLTGPISSDEPIQS